jgi:uncharacterized protein
MTKMPRESADLLDVNVWLALADENHAHHKRARRYWERESAPQLAFSRMSMLGLLRLSTNRHVMSGQPFTPAQAWTAYRNFRALPEVIFLNDPPDLETRMAAWSDTADFPVGRWTDCYLAALAFTTACRLVSFDRDYESFNGLDFLHLKP